MPGIPLKGHTYLNKPAAFSCRFKFVWPFSGTPGTKRLKDQVNMFWYSLRLHFEQIYLPQYYMHRYVLVVFRTWSLLWPCLICSRVSFSFISIFDISQKLCNTKHRYRLCMEYFLSLNRFVLLTLKSTFNLNFWCSKHIINHLLRNVVKWSDTL